VIATDLVAVGLALCAACLVPVRRRGALRPRSVAAVPIITLCLGAALWAGAAAWIGTHPGTNPVANAGILAAAAISAASALVAAHRLVRGRWQIPRLLTAVFIIEPAVIALVRVFVYPELPSAEFRTTWPFILHAAYCFGLLLGVILTLNARQRDPERRVRIFVLISQVLVIAIIALEVAANEQSHLVVVLASLFAAWVARHPDDWATSTARADSLLNSIGVFLFVFDREGLLEDWNGPAGQLIELITDNRPSHGMTAQEIIGRTLPFEDGLQINLQMRGGRMSTSAHIHTVDPASRAERRSWVVMLRPIRSTVDRASFPSVSGELAGHDPATQTLGRRAIIENLRTAVGTHGAVVRVDVIPSQSDAREDEVMFVVARRLELMFPDAVWGRWARWTFVAVFAPDDAWPAKRTIDIETQTALGLAASVTTTVCAAVEDEDPDRFLQRVEMLRGDASDIPGY